MSEPAARNNSASFVSRDGEEKETVLRVDYYTDARLTRIRSKFAVENEPFFFFFNNEGGK